MPRVLVVDDYEPWRRHVSSLLRNSLRWQVVGEASDGLEAVQKATALQPDLILLDIGLPKQNGVQAARHILEIDPRSKILFLTEYRSWDIAEVALCAGARGYIVKSDATFELLPALEAIAMNGRFVSAKLAGRRVEEAAPGCVAGAGRRHEAAFYPDETALVDGYARFAEAALQAGHPCIVMATQLRRASVCRRLHERGIDISRAIDEGKLLLLDVTDALLTFMVNDRADETRFWNAATSLVMRAAKASRAEHPHVAACGECAPALWSGGNAEGAIRLEQLWNDVSRTYNVDIFCGYFLPNGHEHDVDVYERICVEHSAVHSS
jgi:DNA-binding NarL/FixJ family response regulator